MLNIQKKKPKAVEPEENEEEIPAEPISRQDSTEDVTAPVDEFEDFANLKKKKVLPLLTSRKRSEQTWRISKLN